MKLPLLSREGSPIVIVGLEVYPAPALVMLIEVIVPAVLTTASAVAVVPTPTGPVIVTVGAVVYPEPASVSVTIPTVPSPIKTVPAAPEPPPPVSYTHLTLPTICSV